MLSDVQLRVWNILESESSEITDVFFGGAAGSGKSTLIAIWQFYRRITYAGTRGLVGRAVGKTLRQTTMKTMFEIWERVMKFNPHGVGMSYNGQEHVMTFSNGSEILFKDLEYYPSDPNFDRLGSLEITDAAIDEVIEVAERGYQILASRIRYKLPNGMPKILMTMNPGPGWVKSTIIDREPEPHQTFVPARLDDNPNAEFREQYRRQLEKLNPYDKARLLYGDWEVSQNDAPFFHDFDHERNVGEIGLHAAFPILISFDFNVSPCTAVIAQRIDGVGIAIPYCIQIEGGTKDLCEKLVEYGFDRHAGGVEITGDASGRARKTSASDLKTDFGIIQQTLFVSDYQMRAVPKTNHNHAKSRRLCNFALYRCNVLIDEINARAVVEDLRDAMVKPNGSLKKDRDAFKMDACDAFRYAIHAMFPRGYSEMVDFAHAVGMVDNVEEYDAEEMERITKNLLKKNRF